MIILLFAAIWVYSINQNSKTDVISCQKSSQSGSVVRLGDCQYHCTDKGELVKECVR